MIQLLERTSQLASFCTKPCISTQWTAAFVTAPSGDTAVSQALNLHPHGVLEPSVAVLCAPAWFMCSYWNCECKTIPNVLNHLCLRCISQCVSLFSKLPTWEGHCSTSPSSDITNWTFHILSAFQPIFALQHVSVCLCKQSSGDHFDQPCYQHCQPFPDCTQEHIP